LQSDSSHFLLKERRKKKQTANTFVSLFTEKERKEKRGQLAQLGRLSRNLLTKKRKKKKKEEKGGLVTKEYIDHATLSSPHYSLERGRSEEKKKEKKKKEQPNKSMRVACATCTGSVEKLPLT